MQIKLNRLTGKGPHDGRDKSGNEVTPERYQSHFIGAQGGEVPFLSRS
jgi:hypothetical protein